jgi:hypothetical protein
MSTYQTPVPGAGGYAGAAALAEQAYQNAKSRYAQQRTQTLQKYGYTQGADGRLGVDPNNEYGAYQQMLRGEAGQVSGLERAQAGSGWGSSSGYLAQQRDNLNYAQGGEQSALGQDLSGQLSDITQGETDAGYQRDNALWQAQHQAAMDAIQQQQWNPADYTGIGADPAAPAPGLPAKPAPLRTVKPAVHAANKQKLLATKKKKGVKK